MTDLFGHAPKPKQPKRSVGYGNAMFLTDLATGVPDTTMRVKFTQGEYPNIHLPSIPGWRRLAGRSTHGGK